MLKFVYSLLLAFALCLTVNAEDKTMPDWGISTVKNMSEKGLVYFYMNNHWIANIAVIPKDAFTDLKCEIRDGRLIVDTTKVFETDEKARITFRTIPHRPVAGFPGKPCVLTLNIGGTPEGLTADMYYEGRLGAGDKSYYKRIKLSIPQQPKDFIFGQLLPENIDLINLRCDLKKPGVYSIGKITLDLANNE